MISVTWLWLYLLAAFVIPITFIVIWKKKSNTRMVPFWWGMIVFFVFAMVLEQISHYVFLVMPWAGSNFILSHNAAYVVYGCLAAGVFEETGRFFAFSLPLKKYNKKEEAVTYGLGHGACEAMLLVGGSAITLLMYYYNPALDTVSALSTITAGTIILGLVERVLAIIIHVSLSVIVFTGVKMNKKYLYPVAILLHALVDVSACLYQLGIIKELYVLEIILAVSLFVLAFIAYKVYRTLPAVAGDVGGDAASGAETSK